MFSPLQFQFGANSAPVIHIIHENDTWLEPLRLELAERALPYAEWFIDDLVLDLNSAPPEGVFYNRMSASSHTRDHRYAWEATRGLMGWLEAHGRRVVNNRRATELEVSKVEQAIALQASGLMTPKTVAVTGPQALRSAAADWSDPFILKPNRGGKGTGVELIRNQAQLDLIVERFEDYTLDGTVVLQSYVQPADGRVWRLEFVGGNHLYTVSIDAGGGFELCPSDACQIGNAYCPADGRAKFEILDGHRPEELERCLSFLRDAGMEVAAMEAAPDAQGRLRFYDVNINTNYNAEAERRQGLEQTGMGEIAAFLGRELEVVRTDAKRQKQHAS
ncbi:hypothetical protein N9C70_00415 [Flavobacteriales bacterium]|jgi:hypothetical protein|nr:hypothetical protein [Flavobacteriales bacterium]